MVWEEQVDAFVGSKAGYYRPRWRQFAKRPGAMMSFNLAAFLCGAFWLAYRKLYLPLACMLFLTMADMALVWFLETRQLVPNSLISAWNAIVMIVVVVVPGLYGNYWYWRKFCRVEAAAASRQTGPDEALAYLRDAGGTSAIGASLLAFLLIAPAAWFGYYTASHLKLDDPITSPGGYVDESGYIFDATGPLTYAEAEANMLSRVDLDLDDEGWACVRQEVESRAQAAGDPETLDPENIELLSAKNWDALDPFGKRLILLQVIVSSAVTSCR